MAAVAFIGVNLIAGAKGYAVTSNSMAETLRRGDVVIVRQVSFEELMPGDVVTVRSSGDKFHFTHRIVEIDKESRTITTRGDANNADDPMPTQAERIVGKMWYKIPLVGYLSIFFLNFSKTAGLIALAIVAVSLVVMNSVIIKLKSKKKRGDSDE